MFGWPGGTTPFSSRAIDLLATITKDFGFSFKAGELQVINGNWYVTHTGLLRLARRKRCRGIHVEPVDSLCNSAASRFVLKATVYPSKDSSGFVGYGDADPSNVSSLVQGAECEWRKPAPLTALYERPMGSASVRSRRSAPLPKLHRPPENRRNFRRNLPPTGIRHLDGPRSPLPDHSPASARSQPGQGLCD